MQYVAAYATNSKTSQNIYVFNRSVVYTELSWNEIGKFCANHTKDKSTTTYPTVRKRSCQYLQVRQAALSIWSIKCNLKSKNMSSRQPFKRFFCLSEDAMNASASYVMQCGWYAHLTTFIYERLLSQRGLTTLRPLRHRWISSSWTHHDSSSFWENYNSNYGPFASDIMRGEAKPCNETF